MKSVLFATFTFILCRLLQPAVVCDLLACLSFSVDLFTYYSSLHGPRSSFTNTANKLCNRNFERGGYYPPPPTPNCGGRESLSTCCLWQPPLLFYYDRQPTSILLLCNVASFQLPVTLPPPSSPALPPPLSPCLPLPASPTFLFRQRRVAPVRRPIAASTACAKGGVSSFFVLQELSVKRG